MVSARSAALAIDACASTTTSALAACSLIARVTSASCRGRSPDATAAKAPGTTTSVSSTERLSRPARSRSNAAVGVSVVSSVATTLTRRPSPTASSAIASSIRNTGMQRLSARWPAWPEMDEQVRTTAQAPATLAAPTSAARRAWICSLSAPPARSATMRSSSRCWISMLGSSLDARSAKVGMTTAPVCRNETLVMLVVPSGGRRWAPASSR